jgi:hypothetical protein
MALGGAPFFSGTPLLVTYPGNLVLAYRTEAVQKAPRHRLHRVRKVSIFKVGKNLLWRSGIEIRNQERTSWWDEKQYRKHFTAS